MTSEYYYSDVYDALTNGQNELNGEHISMDMFDRHEDISAYTISEFVDMCMNCFEN